MDTSIPELDTATRLLLAWWCRERHLCRERTEISAVARRCAEEFLTGPIHRGGLGMTPDGIGRGVTTETATLTIDVVTQALQSDEKLWLSIALLREIREMPEAVRLHRRTQLPQPRAGVLPPIGISADAITMACDAYAQQLTEQAEPNPESIALQTLGYASPLGVRTRLANFLIEAFSPAPVGQSAQAASVSRAPLMVPQQPSPAYEDSAGYDDYPYDQWGLRPRYLRQRRPGFAIVSRLLQIAGFIAGLLLLYYMLGG